MKKQTIALTTLIIFAYGCGDDAAKNNEALYIDMSVEDMVPDMVDMANDMGSCPQTELKAIQSVEGGLVQIPQLEGIDITDVTIEGGHAWYNDAKVWQVRTPYGKDQVVAKLAVGCQNAPIDQPIKLSRLTWSKLSDETVGNGPAAREHSPMFIDPAQPNTLYIYGGYLYRPQQFTITQDLWKLDLQTKTWTQVESQGDAPPFAAARMVYHPKLKQWVFVGGSDVRGNTYNTSIYTLDVNTTPPTWTVHQPQEGLNVELQGLVYDRNTDNILTFLGLQYDGGYSFFDELGTLACCEGAPTWMRRNNLTGPSVRYGFAYYHDEAQDRVVIFGGGQAPTQFDQVNAAKDTWSLDLKTQTWSPLPTKGEVVGGRNSCWAYDQVHRRLFVFGGTADGRTSIPDAYVLHDDIDNASWHKLTLDNAPDFRASCTALYDAKRGQILMGFGNNERGIFNNIHFLTIQ